MRKSFYSLLAGIALLASFSCSDNNIGSSISDTVVNVIADSSFTVTGSTASNKVLPARTITQMLGVIKAENFGELSTDVVTQYMPAAGIDTVNVSVNDIDSCKFIFDIPMGGYTGDSIAPMRTTIYRLNKALPSKISSDFNPAEYYNSADVLGAETYTASALMLPDSVSEELDEYEIREFTVNAPVALAKELFNAYKTNKGAFTDPEEFAKIFPGIYIKNTFGSGRVMNIANNEFRVYYSKHITKDDGTDSIAPYSMSYMAATPEILSNNNITLTVDDKIMEQVANGEAIVQSPAGFEVKFRFPIQEIINRYVANTNELGVVNDLSFEIPATGFTNTYGIKPPSYLLMVKDSEKDEFFATNHVADNESSFYATYDSSKQAYVFSDMRDFILDIIDNKGGVAEESDINFTITPVDLIAETSASSGSSYYYYYYGTTSSSTVTGIIPAMSKPAIAKLNFKKAKIKLTYSTQSLRNM